MGTNSARPQGCRPDSRRADLPGCGHRRHSVQAFTLVELLVVVSIIALLLAILLPSLKQAREQGKLAACASNLRQIGTGVHTYANETDGLIPRGPDPAHPFDFGSNVLATNQLWIGVGGDGPPPAHPHEHNGLGTLLISTLAQPRVYFCPADDNFNRIEELPKIGTDEDAYGSYLYRQLDHLPADAGLGKLDRLGINDVAGIQIPVEALALDTNSFGPGGYGHTNHRAERTNLLFRDSSVRSFSGVARRFAIAAGVFADPAGVPAAIDQILSNADFAYRQPPDQAPIIDPMQ